MSIEAQALTVSPVGPALWSARDAAGALLAFGRSKGEAKRAAVLSIGERPPGEGQGRA